MPELSGDDVLLFSYFHHPGADGLRIAVSRDGLTFSPLNGDRPLLAPSVGTQKLMRDPFILQGADGRFHMVWTTGWNEPCIGYAYSWDLIDWSEQQALPVMAHEVEVKNCWAPEIFYDAQKERYLIHWSSTVPGRFPETDGQKDWNHRIYYTETQDFRTFSDTKLLFDQGFNVIDATIIQFRGHYVMFLKDETNVPFTPQKNIRWSNASVPEGPYGPVSAAITRDEWAEGPAAIQLGDEVYVYFDLYRTGKYGALRSKDLQKWEDVSELVRFPQGARHGAVLRVKAQSVERLLKGVSHR